MSRVAATAIVFVPSELCAIVVVPDSRVMDEYVPILSCGALYLSRYATWAPFSDTEAPTPYWAKSYPPDLSFKVYDTAEVFAVVLVESSTTVNSNV